MSSEHAFSASMGQIHKNYFLRDSRGEVFEINLFNRYDETRDLVIFNLKNKSTPKQCLKMDHQHDIGDIVYSVGNALGEGLAVRAGHISSYTPEPINALWTDIRFSAPVNPGNSGGPLLN